MIVAEKVRVGDFVEIALAARHGHTSQLGENTCASLEARRLVNTIRIFFINSLQFFLLLVLE